MTTRFTFATGVPAKEAGTSTYATTTSGQTSTGTTSILYIDPPANGMAQFKGLSVSTNQKKYLQVICVGVAPVYVTWAITLSTTGNGFLMNCYTGIPQCSSSLVDGYTALNGTDHTSTETATCMADPRYLTWRSFLVQM